MRMLDVALNNLRRRKGRMLFMVLGLAIGAATVVALMAITTTMQEDIAKKIDEFGANILIVPKANDLSLSYGGVTVASAAYDVGQLTVADLDSIKTIKNAKNVSTIAPKLLGAFELGGRQILVAGVRFQDELRMKRWWQVTQGTEPVTPEEALAGSRLAAELNLKPGDSLDLDGHSYRLAGILGENGSQDDDILFIDLGAAQQMMDKPNAISLVEVSALCTACPIEDMVKQIGEVMPQARVTAMRQAVALRMETAGQLGRFALAVSGVVIIIGSMVVLTTMLGAVAERRQEIGLFRALGFRQRHVMKIILSEVGLISALGGVFGWLVGMSTAVLLAPRVANVTIPVVWSPLLAVGAVLGALVVGLGAGTYPAIQAAKLDPTTALRSL